MAQVVIAIFGLLHIYNTKVRNDFVRGMSSRERKYVSIAEIALARPLITSWDNSTRGLNTITVLEFTRVLQISINLGRSIYLVAIY